MKFHAPSFLILALCVTVASAAHAQDDVVARAAALRNAGQFDSAIVLLRAYNKRVPTDYNAELMLGETLYWQGDFARAATHFENVLERDPANAAARRQLAEIRSVSAPWLRLGYQRDNDTQPLIRDRAEIDAGFFINPLWSAGARVLPQRVTGGGTDLEYIEAQAAVHGYLPSARIDLDVAAGISAWTSRVMSREVRHTEPIGSGRIGLRMGNAVRVAASIERATYTSTIASLADPVMFSTPKLQLNYNRRNWMGEAAVLQNRFADANEILTVYGWLLAPIIAGRSTLLQSGYAFSYQDSRESRFNNGLGIYDPYFTPEQETQHSIASSFVVWRTSGARLQVNGSYAFYGRRAGASFNPYSIRGAATLPVGARVLLTAEAERAHTAFFHNTRLAMIASVRFHTSPAL